MRPRLALLVSLLPFLVAAGGQRFRNDAMKVRGFEAPLGWEQQPVGSYARLLAAWETKDGGRMTLVAQKVKEGAIRPKEGVQLADFFEQVMRGYTYLAGL